MITDTKRRKGHINAFPPGTHFLFFTYAGDTARGGTPIRVHACYCFYMMMAIGAYSRVLVAVEA